MRTLRTLSFGIALSVSISVAGPLAVFTAGTAHAQTAKDKDKESARRLFEEGAELEKQSDYAGALARYKDAENIAITPGLKFHKGYCLEQLGKLVAAVEEYEQADKLARAQNKPEVLAAIKARLEPLRPRIPAINIKLVTAAPDAEVQLDTNPLTPAQVKGTQPIKVDPGEHAVTARATGYKNYVKRVLISESQTLGVDVELAHVDGVAPPPPPVATTTTPTPGTDEPPPDTSTHRSYALPIATTAGAVVLVGAGVAFFLVAAKKQDDGNALCSKELVCQDPPRSSVRTFDALALGGFIGGAALAVTSIILWTRPGGSGAAQTQSQTHVALGANGSRLFLEGSF